MLRFFHLVDRENNLSLTTLACGFAFYCLLANRPITLDQMMLFVTAMVAHRQRQAK